MDAVISSTEFTRLTISSVPLTKDVSCWAIRWACSYSEYCSRSGSCISFPLLGRIQENVSRRAKVDQRLFQRDQPFVGVEVEFLAPTQSCILCIVGESCGDSPKLLGYV